MMCDGPKRPATERLPLNALLATDLGHWPLRSGKVRDVYDLGDRLLIVATDRISAFDWVLPTGIPDKGRLLTALSTWWFERLGEPHHLITTELADLSPPLTPAQRALLEGRSMLVKKTKVVPFECVVRGYLAGGGWKEYRASGSVCGHKLPPGLREADKLATALFTPATKAQTGHDENVPIPLMERELGGALTGELISRSLKVYETAARHARARGLILADTKFEWGRDLHTDQHILIDEVLTPDSSRYWDAAGYQPGQAQPSFDKQFVRDWLETTGWDKASPPPPLPDEIVARTREKYVACYERLTAARFSGN